VPGLIRRNDIDEVRARTNIADIVGEHVTLKNAGVGSMKGLCPFHDERSPSFHVRPQAGFYHCFGCGEGGDVFSFLQKIDHVTFQEAVERLAGRIGYELHYEDGGTTPDHGNRARILAANAAAAQYYVEQLATREAEPGRRFLGERGFDLAAAEHFGVGFAPKSFTALGTHLKSQGFAEEELLAAGLLGQGDRGAYDRFRGRLIWPIRDVTGQTVGFGARKLLDDDQGPKYLNTPDTAVYHKSQVLYGLDLARKDIARGRQVVIVEGYTDVMACHLSGVTTAVATCGTSFGVDHIKMIRRVLGDVENANTGGTGEVIFTFDPDEAGQKAASRAFAEEQRFAAQTFVAVAPDGLDPCDLRLKQGEQAVRRLIATRRPMFEFMVRRVLDAHDLETVEGRVAALRAAAPVVAGIRDQALSVGYVRNLAKWLGMDPNEVGRAVNAAKGTAKRTEAAVGEPLADAPPDRSVSLMELPTDPGTRSERDLLIAVLQYPGMVGDELLHTVVQARFANADLSVVRDAIATTAERKAEPGWVGVVAAEVPESYGMLVNQLSVAPVLENEDRLEHYVRRIASDFAERDLLRRKAELTGGLQRLDAAAEPDRYREMQLELVRLEADRRALREA
jgi:DNA primase